MKREESCKKRSETGVATGVSHTVNQLPLILLCDDQPTNLEILIQALQKDYRLQVTKDGETALRLAGLKEKPALVLLDIIMPNMDGYEVCRRLKANPETASIPVIFLTALDQQDDETLGLRLGAADYLTKPFNMDIIRLRVRHHLTLKQQQDLLEEQNRALKEALEQVKLLNGLLPICASCKKIRDDKGYWKQLEYYLESHSEVQFTHSLCPECAHKLYPGLCDDDDDDDDIISKVE